MKWFKKNWFMLLLALVGLDLLMKKGKYSETKTASILGNIVPSMTPSSSGSVANSGISSLRENEVATLGRTIIKALKGFGIPNREMFIQGMLGIKTDAEYNYLVKIFPSLGESEGLEKFINKQISLGKDAKNEVNLEYARRGMQTRIKV